eukprot:GDKJ01012414.1.p1 GENE.GDKJ01012414.1~~GDKJ01012414.1.p1  ORF type:complete len:404 (-),score=95.61 GDKJ01012414.1:163-1353(-)
MSKLIRSVWRWGNNSTMSKVGSLTSGGSVVLEASSVPTRIDGFTNVTKIACGSSNSAFIDNGRLFIYGSNASKQMGDSAPSMTNDPVEIPQTSFDGQVEKFSDVALGAAHVIAATDAKSLYSWGFHGSFFKGPGALGQGKKSGCVSTPSLLPLFEEDANRPVQIAAGDYHTLVLTTSNEVWAAGNGDMGRLGRGHEGHLYEFAKLETFNFLAGSPQIKSIHAGDRSNIAVLEDGRLMVWGANNKGQCGIDDGIIDMYTCERYPRELTSLSRSGISMRLACAGGNHSLAVTESGAVYTWGDSIFLTPRLLSLQRSMENSLIKEKIIKLAGGNHTSFALTEDGELYSWGKEGGIARDVKTTGEAVEPHKIPKHFFGGEKVVDVVAAHNRCLVITEREE